MGQSDRLISDHLKTHAESYDDYIQDFRKFVNIVEGEVGNGVPLFLYCHSMGCAVSLSYLSQESTQPFTAVVAQSPQVKALFTPLSWQAATALVNGMIAAGQGEEYAPGQTTDVTELYADSVCADGAYFPTDPDGYSVTRCLRNIRRCNAAVNGIFGADGHVGLCSGGATALVGKALIDFYDVVFGPLIASGVKAIQPPTLMQISGDPSTDDGTVDNTVSSALCQTSFQDCSITSLPTAAHRILAEVDAVFFPFMDATDTFFQARRSSAAHGTGDPHMQNIHGERFDLMQAGKHTLIHIPRGARDGQTLLHVEAEAQRLGGLCAEMYFTRLNITGAWADAEQMGGYAFRADGPGGKAESKWLSMGGVQMKVARGHTQQGIQYLNFYVKHLTRVGFIVGGLLGEDAHDQASTPSDDCARRMALLQVSAGRASS
jgi:alpha-beta hydrolase superfamily lysophospholipase